MWFIENIKRYINRYFTQKSRNIMMTLVIIGFVVITLQILNGIAASKSQKDKEERKRLRGNLTTEEVGKLNDSIDVFTEYCEKEDFSNAYEMLTKDCKDKFYTTENTFINQYCKVYFQKGSSYQKRFVKVWNGFAVYKVTILYASIEEGSIQNYEEIICVSTEGEEKNKISLNGFIQEKTLNKNCQNNDIEIKVINFEEYADYQIYHLKINNKSTESIVLSPKRIRFYGSNSGVYTAEILEQDWIIPQNEEHDISLKIDKSVNEEESINELTFERLTNLVKEFNIDLN